MKKIPMILLAMFTLSGCDRQEMIYSFNHVEEASVDNEVENTESVDNIQAETEQAVDITTKEPEISDVYSGPTVTLTMVGDVLLHTPVEESCQAEDGSYDFSILFANVKDEVQAADIAIVNQEVIIGGEELGVSGYPSFNAPYEVADALADTGFDVILHGTNHAMDQGKKGITNCLSNWEKKYPDIKILGINKSQDAQDSVTVLEQNGIKIAVLNYTYGLNGIALPRVKRLQRHPLSVLSCRILSQRRNVTVLTLFSLKEWLKPSRTVPSHKPHKLPLPPATAHMQYISGSTPSG